MPGLRPPVVKGVRNSSILWTTELRALDSCLGQALMKVGRQSEFVRDVDVTKYLSQNTIVPMTEEIASR